MLCDLKNAVNVLIILSLGFSAGSTSCSQEGGSINNADSIANQHRHSNSQSRNTVASDSHDRKATEAVLAKLTQAYGLETHPPVHKAEIELRLWLLPGLEYPEVVIVRKEKGAWSGIRLYAEIPISKERDTPRILSAVIVPKSDWSFLDRLLLKRQIKIPFDTRNGYDDGESIPDEGQIFIQLRNGFDYDYAGYRAFTKDPVGENLMLFCKELKENLNDGINCIEPPRN